jgi:soluble lytic murein transglycosylase-like protein
MSRAAAYASFVVISLVARPARAELVFFANGHSMSVKGHRLDGESLVLTLRSGGEVVLAPSAIAGFAPDEVPYPEDAVSPAPVLPPIPALEMVPYGEIIDKMAAEQGVSANLVRAVIKVESGYQPRARSRKGAMGLMQLMPDTVRQYAVADPYDPASNIEAGVKHLKSLLERLPTDLALAAYNAGEAAVQRFRGIPPYPETRAYVTSILSLAGR